jgi:membrane protein DedA with SNARE-associated domain
LATAVAFSRVRTRVHYPGDVIAGAAVGATSAIATRNVWGVAPREPAQARRVVRRLVGSADANGDGLAVIVNSSAGSSDDDSAHDLHTNLPGARLLRLDDAAELDDALDSTSEAKAIGIVGGDAIIFLAGRRFGHRVADVAPLRRIITPAKLEAVEKQIRRRGNVVVLIARFLPGLRAPTFFTVGHARMPLWEFVLFDGAAALVSAPLWVGLGFWLGSDLQALAHEASRFSHYILLAVGIVLFALWVRWWQARRAAAPPSAAEAERD